jgi:Ca2+-binding RTX toxin-like protein
MSNLAKADTSLRGDESTAILGSIGFEGWETPSEAATGHGSPRASASNEKLPTADAELAADATGHAILGIQHPARMVGDADGYAEEIQPVAADAGQPLPLPEANFEANAANAASMGAETQEDWGRQEAGSSGASTLVAKQLVGGHYYYSGNRNIDAEIGGSKWTGTNITFSFATSASNYFSGYAEASGFIEFNAAQKTAARASLAMVAEYTGLTFTEITETNTVHATIRFAQTSNAVEIPSAAAYYPGDYSKAGDVWFGTTGQPFYTTPAKGNWGMATMMHEIGHALGLKHGHENLTASGGSQALSPEVDGQSWSLMTYTMAPGDPAGFGGEGFNQPQSYMQFDIAALQYLYGGNYTSNSGNTTYAWSRTTGEMFINGVGQGAPTSNKVLQTIWDGGGIDTYSFIGYTENLVIDLRPGSFSRFNIAQLANHAANIGATILAQGNIANALLVNGDTRSLIENVYGGAGSDFIIGNDGENLLIGGSGVDTIYGRGGNDTFTIYLGEMVAGEAYYGDEGFDTIDLAYQTQNLYADLAAGIFEFSTGLARSSIINVERVYSGAGNDTLVASAVSRSTLVGGGGNDFLVLAGTLREGSVFDGGSDYDSLSFETYTASLMVNLQTSLITYLLGGGASLIGNVERVYAGSGDDLLFGTTTVGLNKLYGLGGNDTISPGNDGPGVGYVYDGGSGTDTLDFSHLSGSFLVNLPSSYFGAIGAASGATITSFEIVKAGGGNDHIYGGTGGAIQFFGNGGNDTFDPGTAGLVAGSLFNGGSGFDLLGFGSLTVGHIVNLEAGIFNTVALTALSQVSSIESVWAGSGQDQLRSGWTAGELHGQAGDDLLTLGSPGLFAGQIFDGGADTDTLDLSLHSEGFRVNLADQTIETFFSGAVGTVTQIETVIGSTGYDELYGSNAVESLYANAGADYVSIGLAIQTGDIFNGGSGRDALSFSGTNTGHIFNLASGIMVDRLTGAQATADGFEQVYGSQGDDVFVSNAEANDIYGNGGDDTFRLGTAGLISNDYFAGGAGAADFLDLSSWGTATRFLIDMDKGLLEVIGGGAAAFINGIENASGGQGDDVMTGDAGANMLDGGGGNDILFGGAEADVLDGASGNDELDGGTGADTMTGGGDDDTYYVDDIGDTVNEGASGGIDTVKASIGYTLGAEVENLILLGAANLIGTGNALANTLIGNTGNNILNGGEGADTLYGGQGDDQLFGSLDADQLFGGQGNDLLNGGAGADGMTGNAGDDIYFVNDVGDTVTELAGGGVDTVNAAISYTLAAEVENLSLLGTANLNGTGNGLANTLIGNTGNNILNGGEGADTLYGGQGDDQLFGSLDTDQLFGGQGNDLLNGGAGADGMTGNAGDDIYFVNDAGDTVTELAGGGVDMVNAAISYTLAAEVENLSLLGTADLNGTGNGLANTLIGNTGNNILNGGEGADTLYGGQGDDQLFGSLDTDQLFGGQGNDLLNGGAGADGMTGNAGDDIYFVNDAGDTVTELAGGGVDMVNAAISYTLAAEVENLSLLGTADLNGTGNGLANSITGNSGDNVLSGGVGNDQLFGGLGNDQLFGGADADQLFGGGGDDVLAGGVGNDTLFGGGGNDTLTGGLDADVFVFSAALNAATNVDVITDYTVVDDTIHLSSAIFSALGLGALLASAFRFGAAALDADDRIIYQGATGNLFYDADGVGGAAQIQFASLTNGLAMSHNEFFVV